MQNMPQKVAQRLKELSRGAGKFHFDDPYLVFECIYSPYRRLSCNRVSACALLMLTKYD